MEQGFGALSHRSVADRARLPLASTTYYFSSLDDLLREALHGLARDWLDAASAALAEVPSRLEDRKAAAEAVVRVVAVAPACDVAGKPTALRVLYERYVEAARQPGLQDAIAGYNARLEQLIGDILGRAGLPHTGAEPRLVLAVVDGALLRSLAEGTDVAIATGVVQDALQALVR